MNRKQFETLRAFTFALVPGLKAYIAGGFAADYTQAKDVDLWMLGDPMLERTIATLDEHKVAWEPASGLTCESVSAGDISHAVARIKTPLIPIHLVGTAMLKIEDVLETFDISTHRWAYSREGVHIAGKDATTPYENGRVLTYLFPKSTDCRVKKLEDRYGITIAPYQPPKKVAA